LNPKIWDSTSKSSKSDIDKKKEELKKDVRERLLEISNYFIDSFDLDVVIDDVIITGSLVNYNWSDFSDVDLHVIIDFKQFPKENKETFKNYLNLKKIIFNLKHDIKVKGFDVELYAQDSEESHFSMGTYSVLNNEWIKYPEKTTVQIDSTEIKKKTNSWMELIDAAIEESKEISLEEGLIILKKIKEKLKNFRSCGLQKGGEYSPENLVFKVLRRNGYIQKLFDFQEKLMDKKLTLKESTTIVQGNLKTDLENGPANHGARAFGNWQSDNAWDMFAPAGTIVNSFTDGKVLRVYDTGKSTGKVYGTQVTIEGEGKYPTIFYTHLKNVGLSAGQKVKVGDKIGEISEWGTSKLTHVHVGLPYGLHLKDLLDGKEMGDVKSHTIKKEELIDKLKKIDVPIKFDSMSSNEDIRTIQQSLIELGFDLPKYGADGIYGEETKTKISDFMKDNNIDSSENIFSKISSSLGKLFNENYINESKLISPIQKINVVSSFRDPKRRDNHPGVDLGIGSGSPVKSPGDGVVIDSAIRKDACGGTLFIDHQNGIKTRYCHLKEIKVNKGDKVSQGQIVALTGGGAGDIGRGLSTGPHLHFELYKDSKLANPLDFIDKDVEESKDTEEKNTETDLVINQELIDKLIEKLEDLD